MRRIARFEHRPLPHDAVAGVLPCHRTREEDTVKGLSLAAVVVALVAFPVPRSVGAASSIDGLWDAVVVAGGTDVPFRFEIATQGAETQGFFFEGDRKIGSTSGSFTDGVLKL